jgi:rhodanese-related sulfurtransferase
VRELWREGLIPGAFHCPRGMLEFWIDPDSIYYKDIFACGKKFLFYCNLGWRSALAAQISQQMGLTPVAHLEGGLDAWKKAGGPISQKDLKKK